MSVMFGFVFFINLKSSAALQLLAADVAAATTKATIAAATLGHTRPGSASL